jgi:hypothetical protein
MRCSAIQYSCVFNSESDKPAQRDLFCGIDSPVERLAYLKIGAVAKTLQIFSAPANFSKH